MNIRTRFAILSIITAIIAVSAVIYAFDGFTIPKQTRFSILNAYSVALHVRRIAPLVSTTKLQPMLESLSAENDSISYIFVLDSNETAVAHSDRWRVGSSYKGYLNLLSSTQSDHVCRRITLLQEKGNPGSKDSVYEIIIPTYRKAAIVDGGVAIGVSVGYLRAMRQEYYEVMTVVLSLLFVMLVFVNLILYSTIIGPITSLAKFIKDRGFGKSVEFLDGDRKDEIGTLIKALRAANVGVSDTISELQRREDELNEYTNSLPDIHAKLSPDGSIIMVNKAFLAVGDILPGLVIGLKFWEAPWCALTMDARIKIQDVVVRIGNGGRAESIEVESLGLNENRILDLTFEPVLDDEDRVKYIVVDGRDETARKLQEMENLVKYLEEQKNSGLDEEARQEFYKNTLYTATNGKLRLVDHNEISGLLGSVIAGFSLEREDLLTEIRRDVKSICLEAGMHEEQVTELLSAIGEAMTNAIKHAGGGDISIGIRDDVVWACIDDYGQGIDSLILPTILLRPNNSSPASAGFGYSLMLSSVDVVYLSTDQNGTTLLLEKNINPQPSDQYIKDLPDTWK